MQCSLCGAVTHYCVFSTSHPVKDLGTTHRISRDQINVWLQLFIFFSFEFQLVLQNSQKHGPRDKSRKEWSFSLPYSTVQRYEMENMHVLTEEKRK